MGERLFCPNCYEERETERVPREFSLPVKGESVTVHLEVPVCLTCGEEVPHPASDQEILAAAYREYRNRKNLLQPEEIVEIRRRYGLSQRALARLLGWGQITIQRYERGALQAVSHNRILASMRDPRFVSQLLDAPECQLSQAEKDRVRQLITADDQPKWRQVLDTFAEWLTSQGPNEYTGFRKPDLDKLGQMAVYFAKLAEPEYLFKVKLMKLLFYADFKHFARTSLSMSGAPYARLPMGPVPDKFKMLLVWLEGMNYGRVEYVILSNGNEGEAFVPSAEAHTDELSDDERATLDLIFERLGKISGQELAELSHAEPAWLNTPSHARISYKWAPQLIGVGE